MDNEVHEPALTIAEMLDSSKEAVKFALDVGDVTLSKYAIGQYFSSIISAYVSQKLTVSEMDDRLIAWSNQMERFAEADPRGAFFTAYDAFKFCANPENGYIPLAGYIVNKTFAHIVGNAQSAVEAHVRYASQDKLAGSFDLEKIWPFMNPLMNVIQTTAPHDDSPDLHETFNDAWATFEELLWSHFVPPARRFEMVNILNEWVGQQRGCNVLRGKLDQILSETIYLPGGEAILQSPLDKQADQWAVESEEYFAQGPVDIKAAFAVKAGLAAEYSEFYQRIETALTNKNAQDAEEALTELFVALGEDKEDINEEYVLIDANSYKYFFYAADRLTELSKKHGASLGHFCVGAMEDDLVEASEVVMASTYEYVLPILSHLDLSPSDLALTMKEIHKVIMKRSSEFEDIEDDVDIYAVAEEGYERYLEMISPAERYKEISELSDWLDGRECESPYLRYFVDQMMTHKQTVDQQDVILLDVDTPDPVYDAQILPLAKLEITPP